MDDWLLKGADGMVRVVGPDTAGAKRALLTSRPLAVRGGRTLTEVTLGTGRSHQIRVQHAHAGFPLWGDARYGGGQPGEQIALWGAFLHLTHPTKGERLCFYAPPPAQAEPWRRFDLPETFPELEEEDE